MGLRERRERESGDLKRRILDAGRQILVTQGFAKLSIRKLASLIEYSPAAIYHHFKDKEEIVSLIVAEGYGGLLMRLKNVRVVPDDPEATFLGMARAYVDLALKNRNLFRAVLLEDIGAAGRQVWMLEEGIEKKRESILALSRLIASFVEAGVFKSVELELAALAVWCALHGLVVRLLVEEPVSGRLREKLLNQLMEIIVGGLRK